MSKSLKFIFINSTLAFVSAFFFTTFIHEFGHFISYSLFGLKPVLYHNYVAVDDEKISQVINIISALAGPLSSLIQGIIFSLVITRRKNYGSASLFYLWFCLLGFINFFGYLMMTPFSSAGDTGKVADLLQLEYVYRILIAAIGLAILLVIIIRIGKYFNAFIPAEINAARKQQYIYYIMFFPIIFGSVINTLFAFPAPVLLSIIYPATSSYAIMTSFGTIFKSPALLSKPALLESSISKLLIMLTGAGIIINRLLTLGIG